MKNSYYREAEWLKAMAHPVRLCIIKGLIEKGGCNVSDMQACLELRQSTLSMHLQKLRAAGIVEGIRSGQEVVYKLAQPQAVKVMAALFDEPLT